MATVIPCEPIRIKCRLCGKETNHEVRSEISDGAPACTVHQIIACSVCDILSFRELSSGGSDPQVRLYPNPVLRAAKNYEVAGSRLPAGLAAIYKATLNTFNNNVENVSR